MVLTASDEDLVRSVFISQLGSIALSRFLRTSSSVTGCDCSAGRPQGREDTHEFDGNVLVVQQIGPLENNAKGALANLLPDPVVHADDIRRRGSHGVGTMSGRHRATGAYAMSTTSGGAKVCGERTSLFTGRGERGGRLQRART